MSAVRAVVLGAGRVGSLIARDLATEPAWHVAVVDRDAGQMQGLPPTVETRVADLSAPSAVADAVRRADVVIGAVPGALGFAVLEAVIDQGRSIVDIAFAPEDPLALDAAARRRGVTAIVDCGVAPGLSNWFIGRSVAELDRADSVEIWVGGLPTRRVWPFEYRAVFSPTDVIEEYTRPSRIREGGVERTVPALSGLERVELPRVGTLEAFYTDGLRTLLQTVDAPNLREKTLRYPGHAERMALLRETGFFDETPRQVGDVSIAPRRLTEALLFDAWALGPEDEEFTVLRVVVDGTAGGRPRRHSWDLFDRTDVTGAATSMARTTGFPCAIAARFLADGRWTKPGVFPPERLGADAELTRDLLHELRRRGVEIDRQADADASR